MNLNSFLEMNNFLHNSRAPQKEIPLKSSLRKRAASTEPDGNDKNNDIAVDVCESETCAQSIKKHVRISEEPDLLHTFDSDSPLELNETKQTTSSSSLSSVTATDENENELI